MKVPSTKIIFNTILIAGSSISIGAILRWRARQRAKFEADKTARWVQDGPLINCNDQYICFRTIDRAIRRASKWMSLSAIKDAMPLVGQVGGVSDGKRPLLALEPEYVLKPVHTDHRGIREIAFYEAIRVVSQNKSIENYKTWLAGGMSVSAGVSLDSSGRGTSSKETHHNNGATVSGTAHNTTTSKSNRFVDFFDTVAMWLAMSFKDPVVSEHEQILLKSKKKEPELLRKEIEVLRKLANHTSKYYGVMGQRSPAKSLPYGITVDAHLLLQDITINFSKPCVIDIKMGTQCYEPDAPEDKKIRELNKYPQQKSFGFRIVGMRIYDPTHPESNELGFRNFSKQYGRSLSTKEDILEAFRIYFGAGCNTNSSINGAVNASASSSTVSTVSDLTSTTTANNTGAAAGAATGGQNHNRRVSRMAEVEASIRIRSMSNLLLQLRMIQRMFDENKSIYFCSSSILMVYEGNLKSDNPDVASVKMIDFGRVRRHTKGDPGYRFGLKTIRDMMDKLIKEETLRTGIK